jgi:hypothetical protein
MVAEAEIKITEKAVKEVIKIMEENRIPENLV